MWSSLPELARVDVLVVGAGAAGVAAATVAAEGGKTVLVVEKYGFAGGAAVAGMSGTICGLYLASEEPRQTEQVVFGFAERFRRELEARGGLTAPQRYGKTWVPAHDPLTWKESADAFMARAGVRILYHTSVVGAVRDGEALTGVVVASNAGLSVIRAARTIDASGDGAVAARAGVRCTFGDHGRIQNPTMFFRLGGVDTDAFRAAYGADAISPDWLGAKIARAAEGGANLPRTKIWMFTTPRDHQLLVNATRLTAPDGRMLNVIDPEDFTIAEIEGRKQVAEYAYFLAKNVPGCERSHVIDTGTEAGIRQTRTVVGRERLSNSAVAQGVKRVDSIARVPWPIELHDGNRPKLQWLINDYYDVPYGALVPETGENLIVAGRCLSADHEALASARVTAQCFEYGHAAAVAALLSIDHDIAFSQVEPAAIQAVMRTNGSEL
jgi:hypothetical protein